MYLHFFAEGYILRKKFWREIYDCNKCGAKYSESVKFCGKCGNNMSVNIGLDKSVLLSNGGEQAKQVSDETVLLSSSEAVGKKTEIPENMFGTYKILGGIGQGSGGIVYKALHTRLQKEVVIKQIKAPCGKFNRNETDLLKGIKHSYLPQVLDFIEQDGESYTVMDFISGSDIEKLIKSGRKFSGGEIVKIAKELCEAVGYLHSLNPPVIHSDIKPANVMLNENGDICLIDFNVSLVFNKNVSVIGGTRGYAAPRTIWNTAVGY